MQRGARGLPAGLAAGALLALIFFAKGVPLWIFLVFFSTVLVLSRASGVWSLAAAFCLVSFSLQWQLRDRLDPSLNGISVTVEGQVQGLPEVHENYTRFRLKLNHPSPSTGEITKLPSTLLVYWYREAPDIVPGENWRLDLVLRPPWGKVNFNGPDRERWLFAEGIGGLATVQSGKKLGVPRTFLPNWDAWRMTVSDRIQRAVPDDRRQGVIKALAVADRTDMPPDQRATLAATGTAHLLAISGLHVGLAALFGFWLARMLLSLLPLRWFFGKQYPLALWFSCLTAALYAALAGFATSTVRALVMMIAALLVLILRRSVQPLQALIIALAALLCLDPASALGSGFWLSFSAVAVLLFLFSGSGGARTPRWQKLPRAQAGIMLALLPLTAFWFGSASTAGLIANLVAIPWVSAVTVPLVLLALIFVPISEAVSAPLLFAAAHSAAWLMDLLAWMARLPMASFSLQQPPVWSLPLAGLGALLLFLPRGLPHRYLGLALMLPLFAQARPPSPGNMRLDVLDVGQGTAVLLSTQSHLLLYDSGPGDGAQFNQLSQVIEPAVRHSGHASPDRVIISHADLDHAGGLAGLLQRYPDSLVHASLPRNRSYLDPCDLQLGWVWDGVAFKVLHPGPYLPYQGNDSSCVLSVRSPSVSILLPGDISAAVEQRLLLTGLQPHDVLLAPHHGSNSSSSPVFLEKLAPRIALVTAGNGNRFDFPRPEVERRLTEVGARMWSTNHCGGIRIDFERPDKISASSARRSRAAPWRWPAADGCP